METASPNYFRFRCVCHWGAECRNLKNLLHHAGDVLLTRMIPIKPGISAASTALRLAVRFHFKLSPEYKNEDFYVAAHHWAPSLITKNHDGSKENRPSRQFKTLLSRSKARSHAWSMGETINYFESCMSRAGSDQKDCWETALNCAGPNYQSIIQCQEVLFPRTHWSSCGPSSRANPSRIKTRTVGSSRGSISSFPNSQASAARVNYSVRFAHGVGSATGQI